MYELEMGECHMMSQRLYRDGFEAPMTLGCVRNQRKSKYSQKSSFRDAGDLVGDIGRHSAVAFGPIKEFGEMMQIMCSGELGLKHEGSRLLYIGPVLTRSRSSPIFLKVLFSQTTGFLFPKRSPLSQRR